MLNLVATFAVFAVFRNCCYCTEMYCPCFDIHFSGEHFQLKNIHNDMKIAELMGYAEFVTGIPKFMQRIRYLDECKPPFLFNGFK